MIPSGPTLNGPSFQPFKEIRVEKLYALRDWKRWFFPNWDRKGTNDATYVKKIVAITKPRKFVFSLDESVRLDSLDKPERSPPVFAGQQRHARLPDGLGGQ